MQQGKPVLLPEKLERALAVRVPLVAALGVEEEAVSPVPREAPAPPQVGVEEEVAVEAEHPPLREVEEHHLGHG